MATSIVPVSISGAFHLSTHEPSFSRLSSFGKIPRNAVKMKHKNRKLDIHAEYSNVARGGGSGDFVAGFLLGGAVFGTLAYVFAPQIRRSLLNEDEYGFRKARRPIYYDDDDDGLERTRQTLNAKLSQLNAAIDNVSSRLRGGNNMPQAPAEIDPEVEAAM